MCNNSVDTVKPRMWRAEANVMRSPVNTRMPLSKGIERLRQARFANHGCREPF
jgi:hypothetical protein